MLNNAGPSRGDAERRLNEIRKTCGSAANRFPLSTIAD
jgi:hypothetical protein